MTTKSRELREKSQKSYGESDGPSGSSMDHSFLACASLWAAPPAASPPPPAACKAHPLGQDRPTPDCKVFLDGSEKAAAQWELERRFRAFEAKF
jgi:adenosine deaminase